ncbi:MAG: glycosyltransferase family 2 protein [Chloroflexi bacterium]|nr:glycosyltransferase family 2 protein [Chloroflexota bacterium]
MPSNLDLDAVVCTKDRPQELAECLRLLAAQREQPARVIVVCAGGPDADRAIMGSIPFELHRTRAGLPAQRNVALALAGADLVGFFDDDVALEPGYVEAVTDWFAAHPECVGVTGNIVNDPSRATLSRVFRSLFALANDDGKVLSSGDAMYLHHPTAPTRVDVLSGSNMVVRRAAAAGLGFDEALEGYAYMEDVDFSMRLSRKGELWALPHARLTHAKSETARIPQRHYVEQVFANGAYLFGKHRREFGFGRIAFARRVVGRTIAYVLLSVARRSSEPTLGTVRGLARVPSMVRNGRAHVGD